MNEFHSCHSSLEDMSSDKVASEGGDGCHKSSSVSSSSDEENN